MNRWRFLLATAFAAVGVVALATSGCSSDETIIGAGAANQGAGGSGFGGFGEGGEGENACGNNDPSCTDTCVGPTCDPPSDFPMPDDDPAPDNVEADGVTLDENGYIVLDGTKSKSDALWVADDRNYNVGLVSKIHTKPFSTAPTYREVGRYVSVTCFSDPVNGSKEGAILGQTAATACADGVTGCCARDSSAGANRGIKLLDNRPSRTAVDINGDVWVANRAHGAAGQQASVTKIAADVSDCIDYNGNTVIDTSGDYNDDGIITTDCDNNNLPDDYSTTCVGGQTHEFFGLDDECILFTVNIGAPGGWGRPLSLGNDPDRPYGPSDGWAGLFNTGEFFRIDGLTGLIEQTVQIADVGGVSSRPYGAAIDYFGILWAPNLNSGYLFYFDTADPTQQGMVEYAGGGFYGIAIDGYSETIPDGEKRIQQVWMGDYSSGAGAGAFRYRPIRDQGFAGLALGTWAEVQFDKNPATSGYEIRQGRGLGADNRSPTSFMWVALDGLAAGGEGHIGRVPIDIPDNTLTTLGPAEMLPSTQQGMTGAGVASDLDVWGVNQTSSSVVHFGVDPAGNVTSGPDVIPLDDKPASPEGFCPTSTVCKPHPYTYSDFTGFGLRNFTNPQGYYAWTESGQCNPGETQFLKVEWDAETPPETAITVMARSADTIANLDAAAWTGKYDTSPADLFVSPGPLTPNPSNHIQVLFELTTDSDESPKLKSFHIIYQCVSVAPN